MRRRGERAKAEEEARKSEQGPEGYQCTGVLEQDFPQLCARGGIAAPPKITPRPPPSFPPEEEPADPPLAEVLATIEDKFGRLQPHIQVERDQQDPQGVRALFLRGWKMEEGLLGVLSRCLPPLAGLQALHLWRVGLSEGLLPALGALVARCPSLRTLSLEGTPLPDLAIPTLMGSTLTHLSLRHGSIGDGGARLVGQNLAPPSRCQLVSLVLSFNRITDRGAADIAQGLRLNRSLLSLSLANNDIGDAGATSLAQVLAPFPLTHAEVVERRRLLLGRSLMALKDKEGQSEYHRSSQRSGGGPDKQLPPPKLGKTPAKKKEPPRKEETRQPRKAPELRATRSRDTKPMGQEKLSPEVLDLGDPLHPLLEEPEQHQGTLVAPGNRTLLNLNLSYNRVTPRGLGAFLVALEGQQRVKKPKVPGQQGLLRLSLQKNPIPPSCPGLGRLRELLPPRDPDPRQEEEQEPAP